MPSYCKIIVPKDQQGKLEIKKEGGNGLFKALKI
jgi:hypothetical protein